MPTTYTNGLKLPDLGSIDWYNSYKNNIDILDPIVGTVNGVATTYAPISHNHSASEITSGTIDIARLPPAALERMHIVADQTARYALTTSTVQEGDTVKQTDTGVMYLVVDSTKLNSADGYTEYSAGTASKAIADEDGTSIKSGYVNIAGNQTVSGQKVWTQAQVFQNNVYLANTSYTVGTIPASNITSTCFFSGASNYQIGYCRSVVYKTTGQTSAELTARNKFTNGALDPNGDYTNATFTVNLDADGTRWIQFANSSIKNGLTPYTTDTYNIGSTTNQWLRLFAKFYYYNGVAWGLDQANVWSGYNTFTNYIALQESAVIPAGGYGKGIAFRDYQNNRLGYIQPCLTSDSEKRLLIGVDSGDIASNSNIIPNANNAVNLGTSTNQWKSVYAQDYYYKSSSLEIGIQPAGNNTATTFWLDKNDNSLGYTRFVEYTNSIQTYEIYIRNKASNGALNPNGSQIAGGLQLALFPSSASSSFVANTTNVIPGATNAIDLGTPTNKWKSLNGINPGALSLPDLSNDGYVNLSGNISVNRQYTYTAPSDGWLCLYAQSSGFHAENAVAIFNGAGTTDAHRWANSAVSSINLLRSGVYHGAVSVPVRAGNTYFCYINVDSSTSLAQVFFYFYKAQGNV